MSAKWDVYDYEVSMVAGTFALCRNGDHKKYPEPIPNAVVESLLLHIRILVEMLLDRDKEADAVKLGTLLPDFTSPRIGELAAAYGKRDVVDSPCYTINKRLAHSTNIRAAGFDYGKAISQLVPTIFSLSTEIESERAKRGLK